MKKCEKYNMKTEFEKLRDLWFFMFVCFFLMVIVLLS